MVRSDWAQNCLHIVPILRLLLECCILSVDLLSLGLLTVTYVPGVSVDSKNFALVVSLANDIHLSLLHHLAKLLGQLVPGSR